MMKTKLRHLPPLSVCVGMIATMVLAILAPAVPALAQGFAAPSDEAALYAAAKKERTVVWYGGSPMDPMLAMAKDFEAKYPGVEVNVIRIVGAAQYLRFVQESDAKQYIADVIHIGDEPSMADLVARHYVADWKVPTYDKILPDARLGTSAYSAWINDVNVAYNPTKVSPAEVQLFAHDWHGLLDPRFKGRLAATNQACGTCFALIQMFLSPQYKDQFGADFLKKLVDQMPAVYNDVAVPADRIIAGDQDIYFMSGEGVNYSKWMQGAPIQWVHPSPVPAYGNTWFAVSQFAPHPNAARLFVNWMLSEDGAKSIQTKYGAANTLMSYPDQRKVTKEAWYVPVTNRYIPDWQDWATNYDKEWAVWANLLKTLH